MIAVILAVFCQAADVERAVEALRSDDVLVREKAQRDLEKLGPAILPELERRLEREKDAEVRLRLLRCRTVIERAEATRKLPLLWEQGELDAALKELARLEGSDAPETYVKERKLAVRQALETLWAARGAESRIIFPRSLADWAKPIGVDWRWLVPVLIEWATEQNHPFQVRAMDQLADGGPPLFPVVRSLLKRRDLFSRKTACIMLGDIKDDRAIAELERLGRDPGEDSALRKVSRQAMVKQRIRQLSER